MSENNGLIKRDQYITRYEPQDFDGLARLSKAVVRSGLAPDNVNSPEDAMVILMTGAELGLTAMQSLRSIYVVKGKPTMAADLMKALVLASGECEKWEYEEKSKDRCRAIVQRRGSKPEVYEWTIQDARAAGLNSSTWKSYPSQMLRHRVDADAARGEFPHLILGMYTPDELGGEPPELVDAPRVIEREAPAEDAPPAVDDGIVDAEFEEAPAERRPVSAEARKRMSDSMGHYQKSAKQKQAEEHAARSRASNPTPAAAPLELEGESVSEKKAWATLNAAIHAQAKGLNDVWYRAFHDYITAAVGAKNWNALTVKHLEMVLARFKRVDDPVAWIKETCRGAIEAPEFKDASDGWRAVSELIHEVTRSNKEKFQKFAGALYARFGSANYAELTVEQLREVWVELATLKAIAPNGGANGEVSEREAWMAELVEKINRRDQASGGAEAQEIFADEEIPF